MKTTKTCSHCFADRELVRMFKDDNGSWYCRDFAECLESFANLPGWLSV